MLKDTGTVAFVLYGLFILITISAMVFVFRIIMKDKVEQAKLDKLIELFKYSIVSVAIATVTMVISDLFKEREQDVKELEYFDKYVDDVKKVGGVSQRYQLAKYLAIVAPSGELKKSWQLYFNSVSAEYEQHLLDVKEKQSLDTLTSPTPEQEILKSDLADKILLRSQPLVSPGNSSAKGDLSSAAYFESLGFENLLNKDFAKALDNFNKSENAYNGYHNAFDIARYLRRHRIELLDPASTAWDNALKHIGTELSYGIPDKFREEFKKINP